MDIPVRTNLFLAVAQMQKQFYKFMEKAEKSFTSTSE
jgi:hypothetical protein